ncbi:MAG: hypothetical protein NTZ44_02830 [Candidatus Nomurabacteria bacterium]|nr:hypothetical protein [Candidatus Nomurabacteria bacterium]
MNPEEKQMLQESLTLSRENNAMLHTMRRSQKLASIMRVVYWILILAVSYGAYKFVEPYLTKTMDLFKTSQVQLEGLKSFSDKFKLN